MAVWQEEELVPISALQHFLYCPRQCALIHIEQVFEENLYTLRGRAVHEKAHEPDVEDLGSGRVERALHLRNHELGLVGISDVVEFGSIGVPFPIEYKSGTKKNRQADLVQLAAQAMCLEEMFGVPVLSGALYYAASKRRVSVKVGDELRELVKTTTRDVREMLASSSIPSPQFDARCADCSLIDICQPQLLADSSILSVEFDKLFSSDDSQ